VDVVSDPENTESGQTQNDETLGDEALEQPSTSYDPGEEPKSDEQAEPEIDAQPEEDDAPSHEAVGIGVVGRPQVEPEAEGGTDAG
jgi:hypothetical protein